MDVRDIMTTEVETVAPDDDVGEVLTRLAKADFNGFPVVDEDGALVGIVTQGDLVGLFQPHDRTLWIPIGFPPFLESLTYGIDLSWDQLDVGIDMVKNSGKPISDVMTTDVVTVDPDDTLDTVLALLADEDRDINRLPVVDSAARSPAEDDVEVVGIVARQDVIRAIRDRRRAGV
jgi:CBS domain-containing protein